MDKKYELDAKQCAQVALYMYEQWKEAMKPPLYSYKDFESWLKTMFEIEEHAA